MADKAALERVAPVAIEAYELETYSIPMRNQLTGETGVQRETKLMPFDACLGPVHLTFTDVSNYVMLESLERPDADTYLHMIAAIRDRLIEARAGRSGITIAPPNLTLPKA